MQLWYEIYEPRSNIKESVSFKSLSRPLRIDLFVKNSFGRFQNTTFIGTGTFNFHERIVQHPYFSQITEILINIFSEAN